MVEAEVVNINSPDNSVQVRIHGYQDDTGAIPDSGLQWVKVMGSAAGIMGATATHNLYPGAKVMLAGSGQQLFVVGSLTGYDFDSSKDNKGADNSDNKDPNTPRQVRGPEGPHNRKIPAGQGSDQTSKGSRNVTKTDKPYDQEQPQKVYDYAKGTAPFDKGHPAKFPDLMSIGILKLLHGSNVLDVIDQMDGNVSGAIRASTRIIRSMEQSGFGDALSMMGGGADQATAQVTSDFGNVQLQDLLQALLALLAAYGLVQTAGVNTSASDLQPVPASLTYATFQVDQATQDRVQADVDDFDTATGSARAVLVAHLKSDFQLGFNQAVANVVSYVASLVSQYGAPVLVTGTSSLDELNRLIGTLQSSASAAGIPAGSVSGIGGGVLGQILQQGQAIIPSLLQGSQGITGQLQSAMQAMNTFGQEINAMSEIMGGGASIAESLTGITMLFSKKPPNLDARGFTK